MDHSQSGARATGLLASLRRLGASVTTLLHTRLELIATEIDEERARVVRLLLLSLIAVFFLALGVVALTFFVILLAWDTHRLLAAGLLAAVYLGIGAAVAAQARSTARATTRLFSASLDQLRRDRDSLAD